MPITATIHFTRSLHDDLDVLRDTNLAHDKDGLEKQFRSELSDFLDISKLTVERRETVNADTYRFVTNLDLSANNQSDPDAILENLVETLQRPYTEEFAAGHFDIVAITVDGHTYDTQALLEVRNRIGPAI
jgi:hypothetical protein